MMETNTTSVQIALDLACLQWTHHRIECRYRPPVNRRNAVQQEVSLQNHIVPAQDKLNAALLAKFRNQQRQKLIPSADARPAICRLDRQSLNNHERFFGKTSASKVIVVFRINQMPSS